MYVQFCVCLSIRLLKDILVASFGGFMNEAAINICLRVFVLVCLNQLDN